MVLIVVRVQEPERVPVVVPGPVEDRAHVRDRSRSPVYGLIDVIQRSRGARALVVAVVFDKRLREQIGGNRFLRSVDFELSHRTRPAEHLRRAEHLVVRDVLDLCAVVVEGAVVIAEERGGGFEVRLAAWIPARAECNVDRMRNSLLELPAGEVEVPRTAVRVVGATRSRVDHVDAANLAELAFPFHPQGLTHDRVEGVVVFL